MKKYINLMKRNIDFILGVVFIIYFICLIFLSKLYFKYIFIILGISFIIYHFIKDKLKNKRKLYQILKIIFSIFISIFIAIEGAIAFYPNKSMKECDYIIILGALVNKNRPSQTLQDRLDAAIEYLNKSKDDAYIIVSGGQGRSEDISEAQSMYEYLIKNNVDEKIIIKEDKSRTTEENFKYSKKIIEEHSNKHIEDISIKVVTTDFHSFRSKLISQRFNYDSISFYTSISKYNLVPLNYLREFFAIMHYFLLGN